MKKTIPFMLVASVVAASSQAHTMISEPFTPYVGVKGGYQFSADDATYGGDDPDGAVLGFYGGVTLPYNLSWELGYQWHDTLSSDGHGVNNLYSVDVDTTLIETALRYNWLMDEDAHETFGLYGRLGFVYWDMDVDTNNNGSRLDYSDDGFAPLGELGVQYFFTPNLSLNMGYQYIYGIGDDKESHENRGGEYDSHSIMAGLTYYIGDHPSHMEAPAPMPVTSATFEGLSGRVSTFNFDKGQKQTDVAAELSEAMNVLGTYGQSQIDLVGYTDASGPAAYNQKLSEKRAHYVADVLMAHGVDASRMSVRGEGENNPIASNETREGRRQNRRV